MSSKTKFTPGPWEVGFYGNGIPGIVYCNNALGSAVAIVYGEKLPYSVFSRDEEKANAHLIAAAPELYARIEKAIELIDGDLTGVEWKQACHDFVREAKQDLAKARGEA